MCNFAVDKCPRNAIMGTCQNGSNTMDRLEDLMKNIILIGMPGTGKSVVGRALAERLRCAFVDADELIVETAGKTLPEILRTEGLDAF